MIYALRPDGTSYIIHQTSYIKHQTMENKTIWSKILKITITVLTAIATAFGLQACGVL